MFDEFRYDVREFSFWIFDCSIFFRSRSLDSRTPMRRSSQQWVGQIPTIIRDMFRRSTKRKIVQLNREMNTLSTILIDSSGPIETIPPTVNTDAKHDICLVSESPHYIVRVR